MPQAAAMVTARPAATVRVLTPTFRCTVPPVLGDGSPTDLFLLVRGPDLLGQYSRKGVHLLLADHEGRREHDAGAGRSDDHALGAGTRLHPGGVAPGELDAEHQPDTAYFEDVVEFLQRPERVQQPPAEPGGPVQEPFTAQDLDVGERHRR